MKMDGQCHCGAIRYEAEVDPGQVAICHCTACQSLTGTPIRVTAMTGVDQVTITAGEPRRYTRHGDNGRPRHQLFCGECGSPLFTTGDGTDAEVWGIRWGSIRQRAGLVPRMRIWCRSAPPWVETLGALSGTATE